MHPAAQGEKFYQGGTKLFWATFPKARVEAKTQWDGEGAKQCGEGCKSWKYL